MGSNESTGERGNNVDKKGFKLSLHAAMWGFCGFPEDNFFESRHVHLERLDTRQTRSYIAYI